jgi:acyl-CoA reductase-like NAD-dependent aldehyde dehydrogenase
MTESTRAGRVTESFIGGKPVSSGETYANVDPSTGRTLGQVARAGDKEIDRALPGAVWTASLSRAHRVAAEIEAGQVYVNTYGAGGGVELPFGGFRKSGYGREKGVDALDSYPATKTIVVQL